MRIRITKIFKYRADWENIPGSPIIGHGSTPEEAVSHLFLQQILSEKDLVKYAKIGEGLEIVYEEISG